MGLCKCPKRRVTNQFCFEHRVCVCENCMVTNHPICVVQSYLQWLQDSDYNSICELCSKDLNVDDSIRLTCYHVFHWSCLDHYARQLPSTTAPRGYTCPSCKSPLFPAPNLISPVADVLKEKLAGVNWARAGLGLPLLSEEREVKSVTPSTVVTNNHSVSPPRATPSPSHSVINVTEDQGAFHRTDSSFQNSTRRVFQDVRDAKSVRFDHDEDKYKRKSVLELLSNWWRITYRPSVRSRGTRSTFRRFCMIGFFIIIAFILFMFVMSRLGRHFIQNDPSLDIVNNEFVNVRDK
ncbi:unnamed protein product [Callosobruchus maculatus]|uniref:Zinc finger protein-like 1 homolog n=1 Tax=Callosobruchus maculatus TaxID=64391 RepID=A0A653DLA3_CALMS|nr:unnamed protein product [Callosobruchus maculatus]